LSRVANTYWVDGRISSQRVASRTASTLPSVKELSLDLVGTRAEVRRRGGVIPSWVIFGMVILTAFALGVTVTMRTHAQMRTASDRYEKVQHDVDALRRSNAVLERDIQRLRSDPRAIESAARSLNMARANEIIVPVE
jgi:cell division protein FtsB